MTILLAKSRKIGRQLTLQQHLFDTENAAGILFRPGTRWANSFLRFFKLDPGVLPKFQLNLGIAALFHDAGKANVDFQRAVTTGSSVVQALRHEHLSALLLAHPRVDTWLSANRLIDPDIVLAAVLSHHLKARSESGQWQVLHSNSAAPTKLMFDDAQVVAMLDRVSVLGDLPPLSQRFPPEFDHDDWSSAWNSFCARATRFRRQLRDDPDRRALLLSIKAGLIAADSVASALFRVDGDQGQWIEEVAHCASLAADQVERDILVPRIDELRARGPFRYQRFQHGAASVGRRGLLLAGCGAGKTLAAWRWADAVVRSEPVARVIFLYPTKGTATEGFRDYVGHAPEGSSALVHGSARYELSGMLANPPSSLQGKDFAPDEGEQRLFSLGLWPKRYFSATVDQFLSFMEHGYGGLCLLPALADSAVVFDEVHSYDKKMWNALVSFLKHFDVPVLCMTATLSPARKQELAALLRIYPGVGDRAELADLEAAETKLRYRICQTTEANALEAAISASEGGARVLWVVNTVRCCQRLARSVRERTGVAPLVYHSRFKLEDRQARHRRTVDAFAPGAIRERRAPIAITTQVCEMSLDLDADVLISEHAPISSLVQRFGRAYRHSRSDASFRALVFVYAPESALPYEPGELDAARNFITSVDGCEVSQRDLADGLERFSPPERSSSGASRFLDGGFFATPGSLREDGDSGCVAILDADIDAYMALEKRSEATDGLRLPVPKRYAIASEDSRLPPWLKVADARRYDSWLGFMVDQDAVAS